MSEIVEFRFPSDPQWLKSLRQFVTLVCHRSGFSEDQAAALTLAVDEACANIIKHTYRGQCNQPITMRCVLSEGQLEFQLEDCGPPLDPRKVKPREFDELRPGGLGTHFIRAAVDEVIYDQADGTGNRVRLIKYKCGNDEGAGNED